jgi:hypothetical protein
MEDSNDTSSIDFLLSSVPVNVTQSQREKTEVVEMAEGSEQPRQNPSKAISFINSDC